VIYDTIVYLILRFDLPEDGTREAPRVDTFQDTPVNKRLLNRLSY